MLYLINKLIEMACEKCKKTKLNSCSDCDLTLNADCVLYKGDKLCVEDSSVKSGSSRTLSSIIESLDGLCDCSERTAKVIDGDYEIDIEDTCKILLLEGVLSDNPENITYTITLPNETNGDALDFINKILIFKDVSEQQDPSGSVFWEFDQEIKYDWENDLSTQSFETLSFSLHKVLWLTYIKHSDNSYKWTAISPNAIDYSDELNDLQDQINSLTEIVNELVEADFTPNYTEYDDVDLLNNWETLAGFPVRAYQLHNEIQLTGTVRNGDNVNPVFQLPVGQRPQINLIFPSTTDSGGETVQIFVDTSGNVTPQLHGVGSGATVISAIHLSGIRFFIT